MVAAMPRSASPRARSWTERLRERHVPDHRILTLWLSLMALCGLVAFLGYALLRDASDGRVAFVLALAAGYLFIAVIDELLPDTRHRGERITSLAVVLGFGLSFGLIHLA